MRAGGACLQGLVRSRQCAEHLDGSPPCAYLSVNAPAVALRVTDQGDPRGMVRPDGSARLLDRAVLAHHGRPPPRLAHGDLRWRSRSSRSAG